MGRSQGANHVIVALMITPVVFLGQPALANEAPVADAGPSRYVANEPVRLDGTKSYDPDNTGALTYAWTQVSGPSVQIVNADSPTPSIGGTGARGQLARFPQTDEMQICRFELIVNDGELTSPPDTVEITIVPTFTNCTMTLENTAFDSDKPTVIFFHGGTSEQTGGGRLNDPAWSQKANVISFPSYVADPGTFSGAQADRRYMRPGDMIIAYLSAVAPDYRQPIQTFGWSIGGLLALDVALRLNLTYADVRYGVNHACLIDPSAWVLGTPEFHRRVALLLANPVAGEQCWVASYEAANASVCPSALNVVFAPDHALPWNWYRNSLTSVEDTEFNHGVVAGAYWSILGPGRNLQLAVTPGVQTYKFRYTGSATAGQMEFYDEANHPGRLPEPVTLGAWINISDVSGDVDGAVLSCHESENAAGYQLLFGSNPYRVMDFDIVAETPLPPMDVVRDLPSEDTWWTIRVRDHHGSTIHADPIRLELLSLPPLPVENTRTGKRYGLIGHAILDAEPGDGIVLDPATYEENIEFGVKPLTIRSLDPNDPVIVAGTIVTGRSNAPTVTFSSPESTECLLAGLTIRSGTVGVSCRDAVPTIRNCVMECPDGIAVEFWHGCAPILVDCTLLGRVREGGDPGLVAYWTFDETEGVTARDSAGGHDAFVTGSPTWHPEGGKVGGALELGGVASFGTAEFVLDPSQGPFSVFAWVKGGAPGQAILSQAGGANWLAAAPATGALMTDLKAGLIGRSLSSEAVITDGQWRRVGFVRDGSSRILYVDGIEVAEDTQSGLAPSTAPLYLGAGSTLAPGAFWTGLIDDIRIYNRVIEP